MLFFCYDYTEAQIKLYNLSLKDSTLNILYIGVDNNITIKGIEKNKKIKLKSNHCDISVYSGYFIVRPKKEKIDTLFVYENQNCIQKVEYKIQRVSDVKCILANNSSTNLSTGEILSSPFLNVYIPNCNLKFNATVKSFELYYKALGKKTISLYDRKTIFGYDTIVTVDFETGKENLKIVKTNFVQDKNLGNELTDFQKNQISKMRTGDSLFIKNVHIMAPCGRLIEGLKIKLK